MDPRISILSKRFSSIKRTILFASGKGGVGKSTCACISALLLANRKIGTGLLDLDFQGASDHIILDVEPTFPEEESGLLPLSASFGLQFMSMTCFTGERDVPLRGNSVTDAILELLSVTMWRGVEVLIIDMPPGCGDEVLDIVRFIPQAEIILVTTPSVLSERVTQRFAGLLERLRVPIAGVITNMADKDIITSPQIHLPGNIPYLDPVPFINRYEDIIGKPSELIKGEIAQSLDAILRKCNL